MDAIAVTLAAPPADVHVGTWLWVTLAVAAVWAAFAVTLRIIESRRNRKLPLQQQEQNLARDISSTPPTNRGFVRLSPGKYPGLTTKDAERIADGVGYYRQTFGTKGNWLFRPQGESVE